MPEFPAVNGVSVVVAPRHLTSPLLVDDGRMASILAGRRCNGSEA